jgi:hypothetical protein
MTTDPVVAVARDLRAIVDYAAALEAEAIAKANDVLMPGGLAMVALGHVATASAYTAALDQAEQTAIAAAYEAGADPRKAMPETYDDDDWEPPLQTLLYWSEAWRIEHGYPMPKRPTEATEANFLRWALDWAWDNEPHWDDFAGDVRKAKARMENLLRAGERAERIRVVCPDCDAGRRLIVVYGATREDDRWKCPACRHRFTADDVSRAHAKQLRSAGVARWVPVLDAMSVLMTQGWQERTVRQWFIDLRIDLMCDLATGRAVAWWPDVWRVHLTERQRREQAARKAAELRARKAACATKHGEDCWVKGRGCSASDAETTPVSFDAVRWTCSR